MAGAGGAAQGLPGGGSLESLESIEAMCRQLYESADPATRKAAETALVGLSSGPQFLPQCMAILDGSKLPYAQHLAASAISKIVSNHWVKLNDQQRMEVRNYLLKLLAQKGAEFEPYVAQELATGVTRITKLGWIDDPAYRNILDEVNSFIDMSENHCAIGLLLLVRLVAEMNQSVTNSRRVLSQAQHRKVAISFRDNLLLGIFNIALATLTKLPAPPVLSKLRQSALDLAFNCLSFNFIGTSIDESSEDQGTIHVPAAWKTVIEEPATLKLMHEQYMTTWGHDSRQSAKVLECLVQMAGIRRSLFSSDETRLRYLRGHMSSMLDILRGGTGLEEHDNYHHFCRWLARLKSNYQLQELVNSDLYSEWIQLISQFTLQSLSADWKMVGNSLFYLLSLWSRLVSSMPYLKGDAMSYLDEHVQRIVEKYVVSRVQSVGGAAGDEDDDDDVIFTEHLEVIPVILRLQYDKTCSFICSILDPMLQQYRTATVSQGLTSATAPQLSLLERDIGWLVRVVGAAVGGRLSSSGSEEQELADGELSSRVFQLMISIVDSDNARSQSGAQTGRNAGSRVALDEAIVEFSQAFRKAYIGEQAMATSKVYERMSERLGIEDRSVVLDVVASKIAYNLRTYGMVDGEGVVAKSLALLQDLAIGGSSGRLLGKLGTVNDMLRNHGENQFPFMKGPDARMGRHRTTFYQTLSRILFAGLSGGEFDSERGFESFMVPLNERLTALAQIPSNDAFLQDPSVKSAVIGVVRDLRGVVAATQLRKTYGLFFDWLYPTHTSLLLRICEIYSTVGAYEVTTPLLKFYGELVHNRPMRIIFDSSSPNGILLFRETSKILVTYGSRSLSYIQQARASSQKLDLYPVLYKGAGACWLIFSRALGGNYANFGVFGLYGDRAFSDAMDVVFRLALALPLNDLLAYEKVAKAYYGLLEILCVNHSADVINLDSTVFIHLITTLTEGLQSLEVWMSTQCAQALDHLAEHRFKLESKGAEKAQIVRRHVDANPEMFPRSLAVLFNMILNSECQNQWSLSRLLLSLILTNEQAFLSIKQSYVESMVSVENRNFVVAAFDKLMADVQPNLESKNRDRFTQNVTHFRTAMKTVT